MEYDLFNEDIFISSSETYKYMKEHEKELKELLEYLASMEESESED